MKIWFYRGAAIVALLASLAGTGTVARAGAASGPTVVIYSLVSNQKAPTQAGAIISAVIATRLGDLGGVNVAEAPAGGTAPDAYLSTARKLGADFYVAGFATPIGDEASVVEQLVSTRSGTIVWSGTSRLAVYADARNDGVVIHDFIVAYAKRTYGLLAPEDAAKAKTAPAAERTAAAPAARVGSGTKRSATVLAFNGSASDAARAYTATAIVNTLKKYHIAGDRSALALSDVSSELPAICAEQFSDSILGGRVRLKEQDPQFGFWVTATVTLTFYDCANPRAVARTITEDAQSGNTQTAIDIAVDTALKGYYGK